MSFSTEGVGYGNGKVHEVLLNFEIDESNLIIVSASIKDLPDVNVSRTLSRGNADEKLFLDLEESIERVNSGHHEYYTVVDFLERVVDVAQSLNQVIDAETGEINKSVYQQAMRHQSTAEQLFEQDATPYANLYYAEDFLSDAGSLLSLQEQLVVRQKIDKLKAVNQTGSVDEILRACDDLSAELDNHPLLLDINNIDMAASIVARVDPARAPRYEKYLHDITHAIERHDAETISRLLDEIMPEVAEVLDKQASKDLRIWKGIRQ